MKAINIQLGLKDLTRIALVAAIIFFLGQRITYSAETLDPAQNPLTPVTSFDAVETQTNATPQKPSTLSDATKSETGPLLPPSDGNQPDESLLQTTQKLDDEVKKLDLTDEERDQLNKHTDTLTKIIEGSASGTLPDAASALKKEIENFSKFIEQHSDKKNISNVASLTLSYIFKKLEEKTVLPKDTLQSQAVRTLLENALKPNLETNPTDEKAAGSSPVHTIKAPNDDTANIQKTDETMNLVLEILRKHAVNESTPEFHRAIYRSWYLSLATKTRMIRLNRVRMMLAEQKRVEEFKLPQGYN